MSWPTKIKNAWNALTSGDSGHGAGGRGAELAPASTLSDLRQPPQSPAPGPQTRSYAQQWASGMDVYGSGSGVTPSNPFAQVPIVYAAIQKIARTLAQIEFKLSRAYRNGESLIESGPLYTLLQRPHERYTRVQFFEILVLNLYIKGEAFLVGLDKSDGIVDWTLLGGRANRLPAQLVPLVPDHLRHDVRDNTLRQWQYHAGPHAIYPSATFLPDEIRQERMCSPWDPWRGLSPVTVAAATIDTDYAAQQFIKGLMQNNGDTSPTFRSEHIPGDDQREQIEAAIAESRRHSGTSNRPLFLWGGLELEKPKFTLPEMEFLAARNYTRQEWLAILGVPEVVLGHIAEVNRAEGANQKRDFFFDTIMPLGERLEGMLEPLVKSAGPDTYGWFDFDSHPIMIAYRQDKIESARKLWDMGAPLADANQMLDLGIPERPWHKLGYLPFNLQPADQLQSPNSQLPSANSQPNGPSPAPADDPAAGSDPAAPSNPDEEDATTPEASERILASLGTLITATAAARQTSQRNARAATFAASLQPAIKRKTGRLRRIFTEQRARVLRALADHFTGDLGPGAGGKGAELSPSSTPSNLRQPPQPLAPSPQPRSLIRALEDEAYNRDREAILFYESLRDMLIADLEFGGAQLWQELSLPGDFALRPEATLRFLSTRENVIKDISNTTWEAIKSTLSEGIENGEAQSALAQRVRAVFNDATNRRAEAIAVTETSTAVNAGREEGMRRAGVKRKAWLPSPVENSRPHHLAAGETYKDGIPLTENFRVGGDQMAYPGDTSHGASIGNTINCRCHIIAVTASDEGQGAGDEGAELAHGSPLANLRQLCPPATSPETPAP